LGGGKGKWEGKTTAAWLLDELRQLGRAVFVMTAFRHFGERARLADEKEEKSASDLRSFGTSLSRIRSDSSM
jgi:hypothetical protein